MGLPKDLEESIFQLLGFRGLGLRVRVAEGGLEFWGLGA